MFGFLGWLLDLVRDLLIMAAAAGIAKWAWDRHIEAPQLQAAAAAERREAERHRAELADIVGRLEKHIAEAVALQQAAHDAGRAPAALAAGKVRVHQLLQATDEPYLSFREIEARLGGARASESPVAGLAGEALRHVLIELVADGVVQQLDHDRYFVASDFESDDEPQTS